MTSVVEAKCLNEKHGFHFYFDRNPEVGGMWVHYPKDLGREAEYYSRRSLENIPAKRFESEMVVYNSGKEIE